MAAVFDLGDVVRIQTVVTDSAGTLVDPSEVLLYLHMPSGSVGTFAYSLGQVQKQSTGTYYYNGTSTQSGYWNTRWLGTGAADFGDQSRYFVRQINT